MPKIFAALAVSALFVTVSVSAAGAGTTKLSSFLLRPNQVGATVPVKSVGGTKWIRLSAPVKLNKKLEKAILAAVFVPKIGRTTVNFTQVAAWDKTSAIAYREWLTWHETALAAQTTPGTSIFSISGMGRAAAGLQYKTSHFDVRFVDGPILERLIYNSTKPISRKQMIALTWKAYYAEHGHH